MATIDLSNYDASLHQASSLSFTDGNIFFDTVNGLLDAGDASTYATYTPTHATGAIAIDAAAAGTFIRTTGSFTADGFRKGMNFTSAGYVAGGDNGVFEIASITTTTIANDTITVVDNTGMVTEAGGGDETITGASTPNALINLDGLKLEAAYAFENQEKRLDETIRGHDRFIAGTFKFGGSYDFVFGRTPASDTVRKLFRGSGWRELTGSTVNRIYFGPKGLGAIEVPSIPAYQTAQYGTSVNFTKLGNIDEAFQVFGDAANGNFDNTLSSHYFSIRTYGNNFDRISTGTTLGIAELGGYSSGAALNESGHLTTSTTTHPFASVAPDSSIALTGQTMSWVDANEEFILNNATAADNDWVALGFGVGSSVAITGFVDAGLNATHVISAISTTVDTNDTVTVAAVAATDETDVAATTADNVQVTPWTGMTLEKFAAPQTKTGFNEGNGDFTWVLNNTAPGTLDECVAYFDAISTINATVTTGTASLNGKDYDTWYEYTATGKVKPVTGATDGFGVFIDALAGADKLAVEFADDSELTRTYPVFTSIAIELGQDAIDDALAWFHTFTASTFNTASPTTYDDAATTLVKGSADNTSSFITGANTTVDFEHDFSTDGSVNVVFLCEGDGGVTQQKTAITLASSAVSAACIPAVENNA